MNQGEILTNREQEGPDRKRFRFINRYVGRCANVYYDVLYKFLNTKDTRSLKYEVSICAIFRDEAVYLKEWLEFHLIIGVEHFYLYNNFSRDDYREVLRPYLEHGTVTLTDWPVEQGQMSAYIDCINNYRNESAWIGFIDIDEFVVPISHTTLQGFLGKFKNKPAVLIYWKLFGSSGMIERGRSGLVTEDFILAWKRYTYMGKIFYNTKFEMIYEDNPGWSLHHFARCRYKGHILYPVNVFGRTYIKGLHRVSDDMPIQLNHYFTKTYREFEERQGKGDAFYSDNHARTFEKFYENERHSCYPDYQIFRYIIKLKDAMGGEIFYGNKNN